MQIEIISPEKSLYSGTIKSATFPGTEGSFGVLNNHAPIISTLTKGTIKLTDSENAVSKIEVKGGVVEVLKNKIVVLAD